jgi:hypothetical protein
MTKGTGKRASDQPIWLLVALLLAVTVGIAMFGMLGKLNEDNIQPQPSAAYPAAQTFCSDWINLPEPRSYEPTESVKERQNGVFRSINWLSPEKLPTGGYLEPGPVTGCDCLVFLVSTVGGSKIGEASAAGLLRAEAGSGSTYSPEACHRRAACVARTVPGIAGLFEERPC